MSAEWLRPPGSRLRLPPAQLPAVSRSRSPVRERGHNRWLPHTGTSLLTSSIRITGKQRCQVIVSGENLLCQRNTAWPVYPLNWFNDQNLILENESDHGIRRIGSYSPKKSPWFVMKKTNNDMGHYGSCQTFYVMIILSGNNLSSDQNLLCIPQ